MRQRHLLSTAICCNEAAASFSLHFAHQEVDVCVHIQFLQFLKVPCQLHKEASKGDIYLHPHLHSTMSIIRQTLVTQRSSSPQCRELPRMPVR